MKRSIITLLCVMLYVFGMTQSPEELYLQGANAYNKGDYKTAINYLSKASEQNHAGAQRVLGSCYLNGYGVEKNISKAKEWFKKAKDNGDVYAAEKYSNIIEEISIPQNTAISTSSYTYTSNNTSSNVTSNNNSTNNNTSSYVTINNDAIYKAKMKSYDEIHSQVKNQSIRFAEDIVAYERRIKNGTLTITKQDGYNMTNRALSIVKKTIDPYVVRRVKKFLFVYYSYIGDDWSNDIFSETFWKTVYVECAKNCGSLNFEIFYFETFYFLMEKGVDFSILDKIGNQILSTTDRNEQSDLYNRYKYLCGKTEQNINTSFSANICNSFVEEINRTRSSTIITECDNITKYWPNYQNDIYNPTEEVRLYNKIVEYSEGSNLSDKDFFNSCQTYINKYSNSRYNIEEYIYNGLLKMGTFNQTKYAIDFLELTSYFTNKPALEEKIKNVLLSSLKQHTEEQRLELSLNALQSKISVKNKNFLKTQLKLMETGYTTIKTKSSATRDWVSTIDQYLTCFPTSTHKTELNTLKSKYVAECNRREAEERRRQEEDRWRQEQLKKEDAKNFEGKYVRAVKYQDIGLFGRYKITIYGKCIYVSKYAVYDSHEYEIEVSSISMTKWNGDKIDDDYDYKELCRIWDKKNVTIHPMKDGEGVWLQ